MAEEEHHQRAGSAQGGIVGDHFRTLKNRGRILWLHVTLQIIAPTAVAVAIFVMKVRVDVIAELVTGFAIFGGFLFGLVIFVFQLRRQVIKKSDRQKTVGLAQFIDQLFSNVLYAVLISFVLVVVAVTLATFEPADADGNKLGLAPLAGALMFFVFAHLLGVLYMCLGRTRRAYLELKRLPA